MLVPLLWFFGSCSAAFLGGGPCPRACFVVFFFFFPCDIRWIFWFLLFFSDSHPLWSGWSLTGIWRPSTSSAEQDVFVHMMLGLAIDGDN